MALDLELRAIDMRIARVAREREAAPQRDVLLDVLPVLEVARPVDRKAARWSRYFSPNS